MEQVISHFGCDLALGLSTNRPLSLFNPPKPADPPSASLSHVLNPPRAIFIVAFILETFIIWKYKEFYVHT
jgi:hypothetical protein